MTIEGVVTAEAGRIGLPPLVAIQDATGAIVLKLPDGAPRPARGTPGPRHREARRALRSARDSASRRRPVDPWIRDPSRPAAGIGGRARRGYRGAAGRPRGHARRDARPRDEWRSRPSAGGRCRRPVPGARDASRRDRARRRRGRAPGCGSRGSSASAPPARARSTGTGSGFAMRPTWSITAAGPALAGPSRAAGASSDASIRSIAAVLRLAEGSVRIEAIVTIPATLLDASGRRLHRPGCHRGRRGPAAGRHGGPAPGDPGPDRRRDRHRVRGSPHPRRRRACPRRGEDPGAATASPRAGICRRGRAGPDCGPRRRPAAPRRPLARRGPDEWRDGRGRRPRGGRHPCGHDCRRRRGRGGRRRSPPASGGDGPPLRRGAARTRRHPCHRRRGHPGRRARRRRRCHPQAGSALERGGGHDRRRRRSTPTWRPWPASSAPRSA